MSDSIIMERVACAAADCLYAELLRTEDFEAFERIVAADMRSVAAMALRKCIERFDSELVDRLPRGTYVIEEDWLLSHGGTFQLAPATLQCLYAPEYQAHTAGGTIRVE